MAASVRTTRILGAVGLSAALIGGALVITSPNFSLFHPATANAQDTQALLAAYAQKDSDGDGLPDWEEALYGTDPHNAHSVSATLTDGQAVAQGLVKPRFSAGTATTTSQDIQSSIPGQNPAAGSLTEQLSEDFFTQIVQTTAKNGAAGGTGISQDDESKLVTQLLAEYSQKAQSLMGSSYTLADVHTDSGTTVTSYAAAVENAILKNDVSQGNGDPIALMQAYVQNDNSSAQSKLQKLAQSYAAIAASLAIAPVPPALANDNLQLMQAFDALAKATKAVVNYDQDPALTLGAIGVYPSASKDVVTAMTDIAGAIAAQGQPQQGQPGYIIVNFARSAESASSTSSL